MSPVLGSFSQLNKQSFLKLICCRQCWVCRKGRSCTELFEAPVNFGTFDNDYTWRFRDRWFTILGINPPNWKWDQQQKTRGVEKNKKHLMIFGLNWESWRVYDDLVGGFFLGKLSRSPADPWDPPPTRSWPTVLKHRSNLEKRLVPWLSKGEVFFFETKIGKKVTPPISKLLFVWVSFIYWKHPTVLPKK